LEQAAETPANTPRLARQLGAVLENVKGGAWWTLADLATAVNAPEASVSARLRDCRRLGWDVRRRRLRNTSAYEYRATPVQPDSRQLEMFA